MSNEDFDTEVLAEKLSKLNTSAQSIQSLSQWCVSHRKKARQVVETWDKSFNSSQKEKCISLLYLANDIIQNSKRNGSEFINEFWKVLPKALKHVYGKGDGSGKKVVMRLVNIWEERKVFGSRGHGLKDEVMGKDLPPPSVTNVKSADSIKILKRDANSLRIKLAVGGLPEKILTAFQSVLEENSDEEIALSKFNIAAQQLGKIEEDVESSLAQGYQHGSTLEDDLQDQENTLLQCISQLESAEANRAVLVTQLKEALHDQEPKLELLRNQLQVARRRIEQASSLRRRIATPSSSAPVLQTATAVSDLSRLTEPNLSAPPMMSFPSQKTTSDEESKKAAVAAIAAKLTASTSSAQMLTSVLSSLVAEEMNGGSKSTGFFPPEKRQKLDNSDASNTDISNNPSSYFAPLQNQSMTNLPLVPSTTSAQYVHSAAAMMGMPYGGYGSSPLPPPPPMPIPLARPLPPQQAQPQQEQQPQQPGTAGGYYHPHGVGFFGQQAHQSATASPLPRQ